MKDNKTRCWFCGAEMTWSVDYSFDDYGVEDPNGMIAILRCSNCEAVAEFYNKEII